MCWQLSVFCKLTHLSLLITRLTETVKYLFIRSYILNVITLCKIDIKQRVNKGTCVVKTNKTTFFRDLGPVCLKEQLG